MYLSSSTMVLLASPYFKLAFSPMSVQSRALHNHVAKTHALIDTRSQCTHNTATNPSTLFLLQIPMSPHQTMTSKASTSYKSICKTLHILRIPRQTFKLRHSHMLQLHVCKRKAVIDYPHATTFAAIIKLSNPTHIYI